MGFGFAEAMLFVHLGYYLAGLSYYVGVLIPVGGLPSEKFFPRLHYLIYILIYRTFQASLQPSTKNTSFATDRRTMGLSIIYKIFAFLVKKKKTLNLDRWKMIVGVTTIP